MSKASYIAVEEVRFQIDAPGANDNYMFRVSDFKYDVQPIGDTFTLIDDSEEQEIEHFHLLFDVVIAQRGQQVLGADFGVSDIINSFKTSTVNFYPAYKTEGQGLDYALAGYPVNLDLGRASLLSAKKLGIIEYGTLIKMKTKTPVTALPDWMNF